MAADACERLRRAGSVGAGGEGSADAPSAPAGGVYPGATDRSGHLRPVPHLSRATLEPAHLATRNQHARRGRHIAHGLYRSLGMVDEGDYFILYC